MLPTQNTPRNIDDFFIDFSNGGIDPMHKIFLDFSTNPADSLTMPMHLQTADNIRPYIDKNGNNLHWVRLDLRTDILCMEAVRSRSTSLAFVPSNIINYNICLEAMRDPVAYQFVPSALRINDILDLWNKACKEYASIIVWEEFSRDFLNNKKEGYRLFPYIQDQTVPLPQDDRNDLPNIKNELFSDLDIFYRDIIAKPDTSVSDLHTYLSEHPEKISFLPNNLRTVELWKMFAQNNPDLKCDISGESPETRQLGVFKFFGESILDRDILKIALQRGINVLKIAHHEKITEDIWNYICEYLPLDIRYVPERFITQERCYDAIADFRNFLFQIPMKFRTKELCRKAVEMFGDSLGAVPVEFITPELYELALKTAPFAWEHVPCELHEKIIQRHITCEVHPIELIYINEKI